MINSTKSLVDRNLVASSESVAHTLIRLPVKHHLVSTIMIKPLMMIMLMTMIILLMIMLIMISGSDRVKHHQVSTMI